MKKLIVPILIISILILGCVKEPKSNSNLFSGKYLLLSMDTTPNVSINYPDSLPKKIEFIFTPESLKVISYCNTGGPSNYSLENSMITIYNLRFTQLGCIQYDNLFWEEAIQHCLATANYFELKDSILIIKSDSNQIKLKKNSTNF